MVVLWYLCVLPNTEVTVSAGLPLLCELCVSCRKRVCEDREAGTGHFHFWARLPPAELSGRLPSRVGATAVQRALSHHFWTRVSPVLWACGRVRCLGGSLDVDGHMETLPPHGQLQSSGLEQQYGAGGGQAS